VVGDVVLLSDGVRVSADLELLDAQAFEVDTSLLTGESVPESAAAGIGLPQEPSSRRAGRRRRSSHRCGPGWRLSPG
jgi:Ca2+-transporting ATPase